MCHCLSFERIFRTQQQPTTNRQQEQQNRRSGWYSSGPYLTNKSHIGTTLLLNIYSMCILFICQTVGLSNVSTGATLSHVSTSLLYIYICLSKAPVPDNTVAPTKCTIQLILGIALGEKNAHKHIHTILAI